MHPSPVSLSWQTENDLEGSQTLSSSGNDHSAFSISHSSLMRRAFDAVVRHVFTLSPVLLPIALLGFSTTSILFTPPHHSLFVTSIAWLLAAFVFGSRVGIATDQTKARARKLCALAGLLYSLAQICQRVTLDKENFWWTKVAPLTRSCRSTIH